MTETTFDDCFKIVLHHEGYISDDPSDPGGLTKYGISKRAFPNVDIANLTLEQAKEIYRIEYWDKLRCDKLPESLRLIVFDCSVNQGVYRATRFLQKCIGVKADGVFGPKTLAALQGISEIQFINDYANYRIGSYQSLPHWDRFSKGWSRRLLSVSMFCAFIADREDGSTQEIEVYRD